ncbi:MAG: asparagine synthetase B [Bacteroidales bacterium]|nr:asparagine synthetase B [Bacteroidales bacterium]
MIQKFIFLVAVFLIALQVKASQILIPMDDTQQNHLKAYGIAFWVLQNGLEIKWLLNYRGGSFLIPSHQEVTDECSVRGVSYEILPDAKVNNILAMINQPDVNMDAVKLEVAPKIAVYSPKSKQPWDDAVTLVLTYAEIPYDIVYDDEIMQGKLADYDWLHLHHEDFTGQYGKFYYAYHNTPWYQEEVRTQEATAHKYGFAKVSKLKLYVAQQIKQFVSKGGYLFAMCSATDTYDIALAAQNTDICASIYDGDPISPNAQKELDFSQTFAFENFTLVKNPYEYEFSNIDATKTRKVSKDQDYFTLFEYSAKWDPIPTILCQNHKNLIKGFMGQTTAFNENVIKKNVLIMGENKAAHEARYIHGEYGKGMWTFYGGHDPEDFQHFVYDPPTNLDLYPNSPGYRLILNNILFPAAKRKKLKT